MLKGFKGVIALFVAIIVLFSVSACFDDEGLTDNKATISISCQTIVDLDEYDSVIVPDSGIILAAEEFNLAENETAFDFLLRIAIKKNIHTDVRASSFGDYINGISNIYSGDYGDEFAGWTYVVNGAFLNEGAGEYIVQDGDVIEWKYSCAYGDLGIIFE